MENNAVYWILGFAFLALLLTIVGALSGLGLPEKERKTRAMNFALVGAAIFFFALPIFKPSIWSTSGVKWLDKIEVSQLSTPEEVLKLEKEQARQIERLKEEVVELRREVRDMNRYYSIIFQLVSNLAAMFCLFYVFRKYDKKPLENISE